MSGLLSLSSALTSSLHKQKGDVLLTELQEPDDKLGSTLRFQYFPDSIQDSRDVNLRPREIPGGSLPIYQWTSGGPRTISFTAVFSTDVNFATTPALSGAVVARLKAVGEESRNIDIRSAIVWLRRFTYARYGDPTTSGVPLTYPPRKTYLSIPGSGIGLAGMGGFGGADAVLCQMTHCDVHYISFFPNNLPRLVTVSLSFAEIAQLGGQVQFPSPTSDLDALAGGFSGGGFEDTSGFSGGNVLPYNLTQK